MDKKASTGPTMRKFFSKKSGDEANKHSFDIRTTLFRSDHLKSSTAKQAAKSYKFFPSKNSSRSSSPAVPSPVNITSKAVTKSVPAKKQSEVTTLQSRKPPARSSTRNGTVIAQPESVKTTNTTRSRKRPEPEAENRENQSDSSRPVSHSRATVDVGPKSPVKARNLSPTTKQEPPSSPTKQSKRIRAEEPDPVDESIITGRRVTRRTDPTTQSDTTKLVLDPPKTEISLRSTRLTAVGHPNGNPAAVTTKGSLVKNYTKKSPVKNTSHQVLSSQTSSISLSEEDLQLPTSDESYQLPDPINLIDEDDPIPPEPASWSNKKLGRAQLASLFSSPVKEPKLSPKKVQDLPAVPVEVAKPKKKFFTSRSAAQTEDQSKKSKLDFKSFFKGDLDDTFSVTNSQTVSSSQQSSSSGDYFVPERLRKAHQCHESGETESFDEDIKYYLNGLEKSNTIRIRCLSIEGLSSACMGTEFRMHLRAHDDMPRIISALSDAPSDSNLAFCTATLMFVYNQDRLTMDIDPNHLSLMLNLLEVKDDQSLDGNIIVDLVHIKHAKGLVEQLKSRGHGKFLDPKSLSTGKLALEALLGLTSKRARDWFKDELRSLKGLDFLMNTVISGIAERTRLPSEVELSKIDRTLRVLEAATFLHEENQLYCINYKDGQMITSCINLLQLCKECIIINEDSRVHLSSMLSVLRVFTNITSESSRGSSLMGSQFTILFDLFLELLFEVPSFIMPDSRFDLMVLLLCLCINFVEFCSDHRKKLLESNEKLTTLVEILLKRIEEAKETEQQADDLLDTAEKEQMANEVINIDTLLNQVVAKSGKHMEHSIIAACISLLLGCAVQDDPQGKANVSKLLPNESFDPLLDVLRKLHEFAHLAVSLIF